ncbi:MULTISPECIES: hypothetical protein [unclassified Janthinobacterium]|uniref:hypothetical protein n=1 Tax=unclassified Janthinobacterium TaxID=2610881 RepID=UPI0012F7A893|nr:MULTISPECIES: hypothetical protein [unclassified Janthinobacterium]MEC5161124.1 hypothetical protein [Janthinobacterium sp. CG_S6]
MAHSSSPLRRALALFGLAAPPLGWADCSRDIIVPVAPIGLSVVVSPNAIGGIYPQLLRGLGAKAACNVVFSAASRARLEVMYEIGSAEVLIPASGTPRRDQHGRFVPLLGNRPPLISVHSARAPIHSVQDYRAEILFGNIRPR